MMTSSPPSSGSPRASWTTIIDYNMDNHALEKIRNAVASDRRIGLGITGLAYALLMMKIRYDSEEALQAV